MTRYAPTPELIARIRQLRAQGLSFLVIGRRLHRSKGSVIGLHRRHVLGIPHGPRKPRPPRVAKPKAAKAPKPEALPLILGGACQWTDSQERPWLFCGAPVSWPGSAWCEPHRRRVYVCQRVAAR